MRNRLIDALPFLLILCPAPSLRAQGTSTQAPPTTEATRDQDPGSDPGSEESRKPQTAPTKTRPARSTPRIPQILEWPKDRGLVVAELDGKKIRLADLAAHLAAHYDPNIEERWTNKRELNSPNIPLLLYQYLDVQALRSECRSRKLGIAKLMERVSQFLERDFQKRYKPAYEQQTGRPMSEITEKNLRSRHRRENGLSMEVEALLDRILPGQYKYEDLKQYNIHNGNFWGGEVKLAHIFFSTRDPATGRLYPEGKQIEIRARIHDVLRLLDKDPSQFAALAKRFSEDRHTASKGGLIGYVKRLDGRLPSAIVAGVWSLENGQISNPIPTFFGTHIIKRMGFNRTHFILPSGKSIKIIADDRKKIEAESFLFDSRRNHPRRLYL